LNFLFFVQHLYFSLSSVGLAIAKYSIGGGLLSSLGLPPTYGVS
jgi:hypothetical protein